MPPPSATAGSGARTTSASWAAAPAYERSPDGEVAETGPSTSFPPGIARAKPALEAADRPLVADLSRRPAVASSLSAARLQRPANRLARNRELGEAVIRGRSDGVGDGGAGGDDGGLADALGAEGTGLGRQLEDDGLDHRDRKGMREGVVHQGAGAELAVLVVVHPLEQRPADALRDAALHLALDGGGVERAAHVLDHDVMDDPDGPGVGLDLDLAEVAGEGGRPLGRGAGAAAEDRLVLAAELHRGLGELGDRDGAIGHAAHAHVTVDELEVLGGGLELVGGAGQELTPGL